MARRTSLLSCLLCFSELKVAFFLQNYCSSHFFSVSLFPPGFPGIGARDKNVFFCLVLFTFLRQAEKERERHADIFRISPEREDCDDVDRAAVLARDVLFIRRDLHQEETLLRPMHCYKSRHQQGDTFQHRRHGNEKTNVFKYIVPTYYTHCLRLFLKLA